MSRLSGKTTKDGSRGTTHDAATVDVHSEVAGEKVERGHEDWTKT